MFDDNMMDISEENTHPEESQDIDDNISYDNPRKMRFTRRQSMQQKKTHIQK